MHDCIRPAAACLLPCQWSHSAQLSASLVPLHACRHGCYQLWPKYYHWELCIVSHSACAEANTQQRTIGLGYPCEIKCKKLSETTIAFSNVKLLPRRRYQERMGSFRAVAYARGCPSTLSQKRRRVAAYRTGERSAAPSRDGECRVSRSRSRSPGAISRRLTLDVSIGRRRGAIDRLVLV